MAALDARAWVEVMSLLAVAEGYGTALAAPLLGAADLERLRDANETMGAAIESFDLRAVSERNLAFHRVIWERVPNEALRDTLFGLQARLDRMRTSIFGFIPMRGRVSCEEHERLVEMIAAGAEPLAMRMPARQHKMNTIAALSDRKDAAPEARCHPG